MAVQQQEQIEQTATEPLSGDPPSVAAEQQPAAASQYDPLYEHRRRKILELRAEALGSGDPLLACLGAANSDLFDNQLTVGEALRQSLGVGGISMEAIEEGSCLIEMNLRLMKQ